MLLASPSYIVYAKSAEYSTTYVNEVLKTDDGWTIAYVSYEKPILEGSTKAIKAINKSIQNDCDRIFGKYQYTLFSGAKFDYGNGLLNKDEKEYCNVSCYLTNNNNGVISFMMRVSQNVLDSHSVYYYGLTAVHMWMII